MPTPSYIEALERALGVVIARAHGELALIRERADAIVSEANARVAEADAHRSLIEARIAERLISLKDGKDGVPGRDGVDGAVGKDGLNGVDGAPGRDGVDGKDGVPGRDGIDGAVGKDGLNGVDGAPGRDGVDGKDGVPGRDGIDGAVGKDGLNGVDGAPGRDGVDGKDGAPGRDGIDGAVGKTGKLRAVKEWTEGVFYEGIVVTHEGASYQAQRDTGRAPPHEDWCCIASAGRNGADGRSLRVRRTWSETETYQELDIVALGGASFVARKDDPGACPGEGWQLIAAQGKRGNPGERGASTKGDRGPPGASPEAIEVDEQGLLKLTNADGSTVTCDLYPLLAKLPKGAIR